MPNINSEFAERFRDSDPRPEPKPLRERFKKKIIQGIIRLIHMGYQIETLDEFSGTAYTTILKMNAKEKHFRCKYPWPFILIKPTDRNSKDTEKNLTKQPNF